MIIDLHTSGIRMDAAGVWRQITDCVRRSWDEDLVLRIDQLLHAHGTGRGAKILDLGAGFGNPALGLAEMGYVVTAVENDHDMLIELLEKRQADQLEVLTLDWSSLLSQMPDGAFDCALVLGNALAYQESWPARLPTNGGWRPAVEQTLAQLARIVRHGGLLIGEWSFENPGRGTQLFARRYNHAHAESFWLIRCDHDRRVREIDTLVSAESDTGGHVSSYARYRGFLFYEAEMRALGLELGWSWVQPTVALRAPFTTVLAENRWLKGQAG